MGLSVKAVLVALLVVVGIFTNGCGPAGGTDAGAGIGTIEINMGGSGETEGGDSYEPDEPGEAAAPVDIIAPDGVSAVDVRFEQVSLIFRLAEREGFTETRTDYQKELDGLFSETPNISQNFAIKKAKELEYLSNSDIFAFTMFLREDFCGFKDGYEVLLDVNGGAWTPAALTQFREYARLFLGGWGLSEFFESQSQYYLTESERFFKGHQASEKDSNLFVPYTDRSYQPADYSYIISPSIDMNIASPRVTGAYAVLGSSSGDIYDESGGPGFLEEVFASTQDDGNTDVVTGSDAFRGSVFGAPQGSLKYLEGRSVLVSIFLTNDKSVWNSQAENQAVESLDVAAKYLMDEGKRYGKNVELIYDTGADPELTYHLNYTGNIYEPPPPTGEFNPDYSALETIEHLLSFNDIIEPNIPYLELADKYGADSIGFIIYVNYAYKMSYAMPHCYDETNNTYRELGAASYLEKTVIFANATPTVLAHELLHLFGAHDYYYKYPRAGISEEFMEYIKSVSPNEIMLTQNLYENGIIGNEIGDATAYHIGWLNDITELEQFPKLRRDFPATFY